MLIAVNALAPLSTARGLRSGTSTAPLCQHRQPQASQQHTEYEQLFASSYASSIAIQSPYSNQTARSAPPCPPEPRSDSLRALVLFRASTCRRTPDATLGAAVGALRVCGACTSPSR